MSDASVEGRSAVLLLAYGGPDSLADVPAYLSDVRHGRTTPPDLLAEITRRYALIGGRSPLLEITRRTAGRLQETLGMPVYVGMRHWRPTIRETARQIAQDGIRHVVAICMAPHFSVMSTGAYRTALERALEGTGIAVSFVASWHTQPDYLAGIAANARQALERFAPGERPGVKVVFTAHSLPAMVVQKGDPYDAQLQETAQQVAALMRLPADRWMRCYQSAARSEVPWLGPQIEEVIPQLAQACERNLLIVPTGFLADHVEVLYDIDIGVQRIARAHSVRVERAPMLNDGPALVRALAALARARLTQEPAVAA
jgi:ferrochelatase